MMMRTTTEKNNHDNNDNNNSDNNDNNDNDNNYLFSCWLLHQEGWRTKLICNAFCIGRDNHSVLCHYHHNAGLLTATEPIWWKI